MTTLVVGGDHIDRYREFLAANGFGPVLHWQGRKPAECHRTFPRQTRLVVIMVDQISHGLAIKMRRIAGEQELPVIFTKRSIGQLGAALHRLSGSSPVRLGEEAPQ